MSDRCGNRPASSVRKVARRGNQARARILGVLRERSFEVLLQPVFDLATLHVVGFEALSRFPDDPTHGPEASFADAEAGGLGTALETAVIEAAVALVPQLPDPLNLSLNVSPTTALSAELKQVLSHSPPHRLILEITERGRVASHEALRDALAPLRAAGVRIAVDDVGVGYSGLEQIIHLRPDIIKLDRQLIRGIDQDPVRRAMAQALGVFAREVGCRLLAEGIETQGELATLRQMPISRGQGYLLARPMSVVDAVAFSRRPNAR